MYVQTISKGKCTTTYKHDNVSLVI